MGLTKAFSLAEQACAEMEYPYIFVDQTQKGQVSGYKIFTDIFGEFKKCYSNTGMPSYIIPEKDFLAVFEILQQKNRVVLAKQRNADEVGERFQPEITALGTTPATTTTATTTNTSQHTH